jgi:hypothetical protein
MKVKFINTALLLVTVLFFSAFSATAQENQSVVVDEVIAQVNEGVITLSRVKREMKVAADALVQEGKTPEVAKATVESKKAELIMSLIQEELVLQKGKELNIDAEVEAQVNQRFAQIMKEQNIKTIAELHEAMKKVNVNPDEVRDNMRKQFTKDMVMQNEVDRKVYYGWSNKEIKDYYEKNKEKFTKPETVTLSEIFLGFAGRDEKAVRAKADQLIASIRGGADFVKLAVENSETPGTAETKGLVGSFSVKELTDKIAATVKTVKEGDVGKLETEEGIEIIRVDKRINASNESVFNENNVRSAMTYEVLPQKRKEYMSTLRKESYVKISEGYKALLAPLMTVEETKAVATKPSK